MSEPELASESLSARLHRLGAETLSDQELLALVLQAGQDRGLTSARSILRECGGLSGLPTAPLQSVVCEGVGPGRSAAVRASVELGCRLARQKVPDRKPMSRPAEVVSYLTLRYSRHDQEVMGALYLDSRHRLVDEAEIFVGTLSRAAVEPRQILRKALLNRAAGVVLFHTHPSGDPSPSLEDLSFTRRLAEAGETLGVRLVDHLILGCGSGRWVSLKDRGAW